jgi:hypothetical protein
LLSLAQPGGRHHAPAPLGTMVCTLELEALHGERAESAITLLTPLVLKGRNGGRGYLLFLINDSDRVNTKQDSSSELCAR